MTLDKALVAGSGVVLDGQDVRVEAAGLGLEDVAGAGPGAAGSAGVSMENVEGLTGLRLGGGAVSESGA